MLRHGTHDLQMCRKPTGLAIGYVCHQHEGRCVICDLHFEDITPTMRPVLLCDDCGFQVGEKCKDGRRCISCGSKRTAEPGYYCQYCVALEKDRDGCPRIITLSRQQRLQAVSAMLPSS